MDLTQVSQDGLLGPLRSWTDVAMGVFDRLHAADFQIRTARRKAILAPSLQKIQAAIMDEADTAKVHQTRQGCNGFRWCSLGASYIDPTHDPRGGSCIGSSIFAPHSHHSRV